MCFAAAISQVLVPSPSAFLLSTRLHLISCHLKSSYTHSYPTSSHVMLRLLSSLHHFSCHLISLHVVCARCVLTFSACLRKELNKNQNRAYLIIQFHFIKRTNVTHAHTQTHEALHGRKVAYGQITHPQLAHIEKNTWPCCHIQRAHI